MLHENLRAARKAAGLSQEALSLRLNVVRQTISKWEKGLSVPDAEMLIRIAGVFQISVSDLLGANHCDQTDKNSVAQQLAEINAQLAIKNRRAKFALKLIVGVLLAALAFNLLLMVLSMSA